MTRKKQTKQSGFTMIEMAIVMIIAGLIIAALVNSYMQWNDILRSSKTKEHIAIVNDALAAYASRNYRVPCPARPDGAGAESFGMERGSTASGAAVGSCDNMLAGEAEGILPFKTLGIDAETARDGWGNFMTYQVSPVFTQDMYNVDIPVHVKCRTTDWIEGVNRQQTGANIILQGGRNIALEKARFCCAQPRGDETQMLSAPAPANTPSLVFTPDGAGWYEPTGTIGTPNIADHYNAADVVSTGVGAQAFYHPRIYGGGAAAGNFGHTDMAVYALISHGKNESGVFLIDGTNNRQSGGGVSERVNANDPVVSQNVYDIPHNSSNGVEYYDDIVSWQTQSNLMARLRRDSCSAP